MISKALKIAAAGLALMVVGITVGAGQAEASGRLTVARNGMLRVSLPAAAGSVIVANPNIADVSVVDSHTVYIVGRGFGASDVTILDRAGRPIFENEVMVTAGQHSAVTVFKGTQPQVMVCADVCEAATDDIAQDPGTATAKAAPAGTPAPAAAPAAATPGVAPQAAAPAAAAAAAMMGQ
jgi:Flp pilus assembly secretin CpaC